MSPTTGEPTGESATGPVTPDEAIELGATLSAALAAGDVEAWLAMTELSESAQQQQRDWFAGVQTVPMEVREMHPTFLVRADDGAGGALVRLAFRHQVTGVDAVPVLELYDLTLIRTPAGLRISGVAGGDDERSAFPQLWDLGPITVQEGEHSVVIASAPGLEEPVIRAVDDAAGAALREMPIDGTTRLLVEASDPAILRERYGRNLAASTTLTSLWSTPLASPQVESGGQLPDVEDGARGVSRMAFDARELADEGTAAAGLEGGSPWVRAGALSVATATRHPEVQTLAWAEAGLARWFAETGDVTVRQGSRANYAWWFEGAPAPSLPPANYWDFFGDSVPTDQYLVEAASIFYYVEDVHGRDAVFPLVEDLLLVTPGGHGGPAALDEVVARHLGMDAATLEVEWGDWLADEFGD